MADIVRRRVSKQVRAIRLRETCRCLSCAFLWAFGLLPGSFAALAQNLGSSEPVTIYGPFAAIGHDSTLRVLSWNRLRPSDVK